MLMNLQCVELILKLKFDVTRLDNFEGMRQQSVWKLEAHATWWQTLNNQSKNCKSVWTATEREWIHDWHRVTDKRQWHTRQRLAYGDDNQSMWTVYGWFQISLYSLSSSRPQLWTPCIAAGLGNEFITRACACGSLLSPLASATPPVFTLNELE